MAPLLGIVIIQNSRAWLAQWVR